MVRPWEKGHGRGAEDVVLAGRPCRGTDGSPLVSAVCLGRRWISLPAFFPWIFPKKQKSLCPRRDTGRESAFGGGVGVWGRGTPFFALVKRGPPPPKTMCIYRGARSGSEATRSASAGRKGRSRAWAGVTQRSSWRSRAQGVPSKAVTWKKCSCTCRSRSA